jgi:hypothetical protein
MNKFFIAVCAVAMIAAAGAVLTRAVSLIGAAPDPDAVRLVKALKPGAWLRQQEEKGRAHFDGDIRKLPCHHDETCPGEQ